MLARTVRGDAAALIDDLPAPLRWARTQLDVADAEGLRRRPRTRAGGSGTHSDVDSRSVVVFSSNDYLGLATHPAVVEAAASAARRLGVGSTGSRHLSGCHEESTLLEAELCAFIGADTATLAPSGHAANLAVLVALGGPDALVCSDSRNHASIIDGCRLSRARVHVYAHRDLRDLETALRESRGRPIIVSETLFSVDGTLADVPALALLAERYDAWLVLDEAHAIGTTGEGGRGAAAALPSTVRPERLVRVIAFGKALGSSGAAVCAASEVRGMLLQRGRALIFSTAPAHPVVAATRASLGVLRDTPGLVDTLRDRAARMRARLAPLHPGGDPGTPIVPVMVGDAKRATELESRLLDRGFLVQAVRPPTVPDGESRLRLSVSAAHTPDEVDGAAAAILAVFAETH